MFSFPLQLISYYFLFQFFDTLILLTGSIDKFFLRCYFLFHFVIYFFLLPSFDYYIRCYHWAWAVFYFPTCSVSLGLQHRMLPFFWVLPYLPYSITSTWHMTRGYLFWNARLFTFSYRYHIIANAPNKSQERIDLASIMLTFFFLSIFQNWAKWPPVAAREAKNENIMLNQYNIRISSDRSWFVT